MNLNPIANVLRAHPCRCQLWQICMERIDWWRKWAKNADVIARGSEESR